MPDLPTNSDALAQLEKICLAPLPVEALAVLTNYPEILLKVPRADDGSESEGFVSEAELLADPAEVVRINREVRLESILDPESREFHWPNSFLVIGETGDGDYYCIDVEGGHPGVLQFRHHAVEFEIVADSMNEFIELLVECFVMGDDGDPVEEDEDFVEEDVDDEY